MGRMGHRRASDPETSSRSDLGSLRNESDQTIPNALRIESNLQAETVRPSLYGNQLQSSGTPLNEKQTTNRPPRESHPNGQARPRPTPRESSWVDEGYYQENPWHNQENKKPIFSLGRPLPRKVRWNDPREHQETPPRPRHKSQEDLAEKGEVDSDNTATPGVGMEEMVAREQRDSARRTAEGVSHGDRVNDAGQPVFDYMPDPTSHENSRQDNSNTNHNSNKQQDGPDFGIDSEPLGQRENDEVEEYNKNPDDYRNWWARVRAKHPEPLAEFLATTVAVFMGLAGTMSVNLSADQPTQYGTYETSCWAWGFAWMFGIYLGGGVSGAHMNPAISFSLSLFRGFPWKQCAIYVVAQFVASIVAGALAYGAFRDTIRHVDPTMVNTAKTFFSTPQEWVSLGTAFFNQMLGSAVMMIAVFALGDDQNNPPGAGMHALVLGLLVTLLKFTLGYNIGSALNPASDFGPRLIALAIGYRDSAVFQTGWWLYGPWLATLTGSVVGCSIYDSFIFVGSESPINYRVPKKFRTRVRRFLDFGAKK
ncbi:aquaporin-like protein [Xylariomycetidae sp. FL2044]|nr:aquaporin-like protein [Xylariomycetidae sp. FL2044]